MNSEKDLDTIASLQMADPKALHELYTLYNENTKKLREAFERLEQRFREIDPYNIYGSINEALITLDASENVLTFNKAAERIFNVREQDVAGKPFRQIVPPCEKAYDEYLQDNASEKHHEITFKKEDGERVFLRGRFSPLLDRHGEEIGTTCLFTDLSVERILEEKARRSDRLTALGELAAGVAHEMRNPLTTIRGYLQILPDNKDDEAFISEFTHNLIREIDRLTRLTENLLNMAKPISPELQQVSLSDLVQSVALFLMEKFEQANVRFSMDDQAPSTRVFIDKDRMKQVFINLFMNAIEAMEGGGEVKVRFTHRKERLSESDEPWDYVVTEISDTGPGIPAKVLERLFDPFFTTKDSGTGLGLSLSNRIVEEHGGFLRVDSTEGEGTQFWVLLPVPDQMEIS